MSIVVSKFGGSSMKNYGAMVRSAQIAVEQKSSVVLVSATYGTTDQLVALAAAAGQGLWEECQEILFELREKHLEIFHQLGVEELHDKLIDIFDELEMLAHGMSLLKECSPKAKDQLMSIGERASSLIFSYVFQQQTNREVKCFDIRQVMKTDSHFGNATPCIKTIAEKAQTLLNINENICYVTQGFIGMNAEGATTTLGRGGSDYSAALIAEAVDADVLEIWTDVAGVATTDPRICPNVRAIDEITYNEASEMAQYGAKVLHPTTLLPAMRKDIPVFVGSSYDKEAKGTWIRREVENSPLIRAIAKRENQTLLVVRTPKMLNAFGFMSKIFDVFSRFRISVDCITTSEISVAITLDQSTVENTEFINELKELGDVQLESGYALVSLIGNDICETPGVAKNIFKAIEDINVRMMSLGASDFNFNFLVKSEDCNNAIQKLHKRFIEDDNEDSSAWVW
jgi:aspartate kinase